MKIRATVKLHNDIIKSRREFLGMNQTDYAKFVGVPLPFLVAAELMASKYIRRMRWDTAQRHAEALAMDCDCSVEDIWFEGMPKEASVMTSTCDVSRGELEAVLSRMRLIATDCRPAEYLAETKDKINNILQSLSYREREVIKHTYGIGARILTSEELGYKFNVTRERIRQIESAALRKLQHPVRSRQLEPVMDQLAYAEDA